jgi:hypothetical protein
MTTIYISLIFNFLAYICLGWGISSQLAYPIWKKRLDKLSECEAWYYNTKAKIEHEHRCIIKIDPLYLKRGWVIQEPGKLITMFGEITTSQDLDAT